MNRWTRRHIDCGFVFPALVLIAVSALAFACAVR